MIKTNPRDYSHNGTLLHCSRHSFVLAFFVAPAWVVFRAAWEFHVAVPQDFLHHGRSKRPQCVSSVARRAENIPCGPSCAERCNFINFCGQTKKNQFKAMRLKKIKKCCVAVKKKKVVVNSRSKIRSAKSPVLPLLLLVIL